MMKLFDRKFALAFKATFLSLMVLGVVSCADYTDKNKEAIDLKAAYYAYESALIEPETLKNYIDAGYRTPDGKRVVIIDVEGTTPAKVIKGALSMPQNNYFTEARSDGPMVVGNMAPSGAKMDAAIRFAGIDGNTLVVITGAALTSNNIHRVWWTFSYWGFSNKYVKVLNGVNKYFATAYPECMETYGAITVKPSTFSVKELPGNNIDATRAPLGEILEDVSAGVYKADGSGSKIMIPTMPPTKATIMNGNVEVTKVANDGTIIGRIRGATQLNVPNNTPSQYVAADGRYKTAEEIAAAITTFNNAPFLPVDKTKRIIVHCGAGQSTAPHFFVLKEILGYRNTAIYDGSWNEWGNLAVYITATQNETFAKDVTTPSVKSATSYLTWNVTLNNYIDSFTTQPLLSGQIKPSGVFSNLKYDTSRYTDYLLLGIKSVTDSMGNVTWVNTLGSGYDNSYSGDAKEINKADKLYQENKGTTGGGANNPATGGGAPSGC